MKLLALLPIISLAPLLQPQGQSQDEMIERLLQLKQNLAERDLRGRELERLLRFWVTPMWRPAK